MIVSDDFKVQKLPPEVIKVGHKYKLYLISSYPTITSGREISLLKVKCTDAEGLKFKFKRLGTDRIYELSKKSYNISWYLRVLL